jgi:hypothetical protein
MVATGKYQVIAREEIDKLLANQQIQVSSISSRENVKKLQLQNISYIITGSVDALGVCGALPLKSNIFAIYCKNIPCKLPKEPRNA